MSRLTGSAFSKPNPFEFPRHGLPPSPPETHRENMSGAPPILSAPNFGAQDYFPVEAALASASPDLFGARTSSRKGFSIPYHSSPIPRETHRSTGSRTKALIMVLPPSTLLQEPGSSSQSQSHHVSNTPFHRLSQGVLLPLFPSLFSQLTAIAKEFNFPSTSGLVLYYHIVENGAVFTPRISEDSWQTIWTHLAEPQERPPLISGKIEFDIDLRLARWYSTWLSALHREVYEYTSTYHPSTAPSMAHFRGESRTTMADKTFNEDDLTEILQPPLRPLGSRHVPRKLSLVERLDIVTSKSAMSPPESNSGKPRPLSTIAQEDEPKLVKSDLVSRVKNWRASASVAPTPLVVTGQPSLDPANLPNDMDIPMEGEAELRMSDFAWSVSSAGPPSPVVGSVSSRSRVPSIHIAQRMAGSVSSTESYRTSSGPSDYDPLSPISWSYPPSIHLANRLEGSVCSTASYRTSSGPSDYDPYSPLIASSHLLTPDIAHRFFEDTPPTPQTSTSWGAPSWPPSPRCLSPTPSLDLGERAMYDAESAPNKHYPRSAEVKPWEHVWPYTEERSVLLSVASKDVVSPQPWAHMWPYTSYHEETQARSDSNPWAYMWPYKSYHSNEASVTPWSHVWPYHQKKTDVVTSRAPTESPLLSSTSYPNLRIYAPVYPHLDIYPGVAGRLNEADDMDSFPPSRCLSVRALASYPAFDLYPAVYPYNLYEIYPSIQTPVERVDSEGYPYFNLYPSKTALLNSYLSLHIANPRGQYPHFEIYPSSGEIASSGSSSCFSSPTDHPNSYPALNILPAVYPYFDLYPAIDMPTENVSLPVSVSSAKMNVLGSGYPTFNLYPAVYPNFDLYPDPYYEAIQSRAVLDPSTRNEAVVSSAVATATGYPSFNLYPPLYPYFDLYPAPLFCKPLQSLKHVAISGSRYPTFDLYPAVYPNFDLYPTVLVAIKLPSPPPSPRLRVRPTSRLPVPVRGPSSPRPTRVKSTSRLTHSELHAMVMMEKFGSSLPPLTPPRRIEARHTPRRSFSGSVHGLPPSPASGIRRQASLADRRTSYMQNAETSSTSPVAHRASHRQSVFGARKRDSLVLQKVRAFDTNDHTSLPSSLRESPSRLPLPPRAFPPLPSVPVDHGA